MELATLTSVLVLILPLLEAKETLGGAHSLCLSLIVRTQTYPDNPWCEAQGLVDGKPFLLYDSDNGHARPLGRLGEKVKDTEAWRDLPQTLRDVGQDLRMNLLSNELEKDLSRGAPILQAKLCCQREAGQYTAASWEFSINRHTAVIDTKTKQWIMVDPGARGIKEQWERNRDLAEHLRKISLGDCSHWFKEFLEHWDTMLEPTAPPSTTQNAIPSSSATLLVAGSILAVCMPCLIIFLPLKYHKIRQVCKKGSEKPQTDVKLAPASLEAKSEEEDLIRNGTCTAV